MDRITSIDEMLQKAFRLAYFIHGDRGTAMQIVSGAMAKLDVAVAAQGKRLYYKPTGRALLHRTKLDQFRSKAAFSELHLLQRLIYVESEPYEKQREQASNGAGVRKEDLLVHFIKHLVRITLKRNSFYVTLGMSRLLYNYTTSETMGIYNVVVQDPERVKDDYYYRSRKGVLMQEIKERFGDFVRISHGQRGEERFQAEPEPGQFKRLVGDCLSLFTPWSTPCLVPAGYDPITQSIPSLVFQGEDKEDRTEVNRIHAAIHPNCYERMVSALGFHTPDHRLEVPHFFLSRENGNRNDGYRDRYANTELGREDLTTIKDELDELARRRRRATAGLLRVVVDGVEHARLDTEREPRLRFTLDGQRELLEVWTADEAGALLLSTYLFKHREPDEAHLTKSSIALGGGHHISLAISASGDDSRQVVELGYERPGSIKARAAMFWQFLTSPAASRQSAGTSGWMEPRRSRVLVYASAVVLLLIFAAVATVYWRGRTNETNLRAGLSPASQSLPPGQDLRPGPNTPANSTIEPSSSAQPSVPVGQRNQTGSRATLPARSEKSGLSTPRTLENTGAGGSQTPVGPEAATSEKPSSDEEVTRTLRSPEKRLLLADVKTIFPEVVGSEPSAQLLREMLGTQIQKSKGFSLARDRAEADALLRVSGGGGPAARPTFAVQLINARGQVIWPLKGATSQRSYSGPPEQISAQILKDLLNDLEHVRKP